MAIDFDIKRLEPLVGRWRSEGHVVGEPPIPIVGTDIYEWLPGGFFLVHHIDVTVGGEPVRGIEMIGELDPLTGSVVARSYDDTGTVTIMHVSIDAAGVMTFTGGGDVAPVAQSTPTSPRGSVRSTLTVDEDRDRMTARWERADDGVSWEAWMDMSFTRMS